MNNYRITITRKISELYSVSIETEVQWGIEVNDNDKKLAIARATNDIDNIGRELVQHYGGAGKGGLPLQGDAHVTKRFEKGKLSGEKKGGKIYAKMTVPGYEKFGINVWPEQLADARLSLEDIIMEDFNCEAIDVLFIDGKPKKVVGFMVSAV